MPAPARVFAVCFAWFALLAAPAAGEGANACWAPADLAASPGEKQARRHAYNPAIEPRGELAPSPPIDPMFRGSIRRVELPPGEKLIALTFDLCEGDNEISGYDGEVVDVLRRLGVKATFFASGKWLMDHKVRALQLLSDPLFEAGAHSWTHRNYRHLSPARVRADLELNLKADAALRAELSAKACFKGGGRKLAPLSLFRFPFGVCNGETLKAVNDAGLYAIQWDVVSGDPSPAQTAEGIRRAVISSAKPGSIVAMHSNGRGWHTAQALPRLIEELRLKGFAFVTVSELLARGRPVIAGQCYELRPGDNDRYDWLFSARSRARW